MQWKKKWKAKHFSVFKIFFRHAYQIKGHSMNAQNMYTYLFKSKSWMISLFAKYIGTVDMQMQNERQ